MPSPSTRKRWHAYRCLEKTPATSNRPLRKLLLLQPVMQLLPVSINTCACQAAGGIVSSQAWDSSGSSSGRGAVYRLIERVSSQVRSVFLCFTPLPPHWASGSTVRCHTAQLHTIHHSPACEFTFCATSVASDVRNDFCFRTTAQFPGLNTSRAFGDVAAQQLGLSSAPAMQAFELTAQDAFVVRCIWRVLIPANMLATQLTCCRQRNMKIIPLESVRCDVAMQRLQRHPCDLAFGECIAQTLLFSVSQITVDTQPSVAVRCLPRTVCGRSCPMRRSWLSWRTTAWRRLRPCLLRMPCHGRRSSDGRLAESR